MEIFASKINALLSRVAARDLYDTHNLIHYGLFDESQYELLRKSVVFYTAISYTVLIHPTTLPITRNSSYSPTGIGAYLLLTDSSLMSVSPESTLQ